jgi:hypothetical protein
VRGTNTATQTSPDGTFSISAPQGSTLVFTSVGFLLQEAAVGTNDNVTIALQTQNRELTEVVVTALGQTSRRDKLGYAATTFRADEVTRSAPISALDGLQGKVPGAEISTIGGVGSSSKIILRGYSSLSTTESNQPLIIVDGVPFNNSRLGSFNDFANSGGVDVGNGLNDLNPNDIENISIFIWIKGTEWSCDHYYQKRKIRQAKCRLYIINSYFKYWQITRISKYMGTGMGCPTLERGKWKLGTQNGWKRATMGIYSR